MGNHYWQLLMEKMYHKSFITQPMFSMQLVFKLFNLEISIYFLKNCLSIWKIIVCVSGITSRDAFCTSQDANFAIPRLGLLYVFVIASTLTILIQQLQELF